MNLEYFNVYVCECCYENVMVYLRFLKVTKFFLSVIIHAFLSLEAVDSPRSSFYLVVLRNCYTFITVICALLLTSFKPIIHVWPKK